MAIKSFLAGEYRDKIETLRMLNRTLDQNRNDPKLVSDCIEVITRFKAEKERMEKEHPWLLTL